MLGIATRDSTEKLGDSYAMDMSEIGNSLLQGLTKMAYREALVQATGHPYDPEGRRGGSLEDHGYLAVRELSRHLYLYNVPHKVYRDESGDEDYWWVVSDPGNGFTWHCHLTGTGRENRMPGASVTPSPPPGVDFDSMLVVQAEPWESDPEWDWNPETLDLVE